MSAARFIIGDTRDVVATLADGSIDLVLTSPPFLALRSYLPAGHPDKHREIGSEATPAEFLQVLLELTAEWRRVLAPHGSIAVELGDTYAGSGGSGGDYSPGGRREGQAKWSGTARSARESSARMPWKGERTGWPMDKSLCGIPHLFHLSLAYGINLLTGEPSPAGRWRVRNVVAWCRPNPPVGALGDKVRPATSYMTIAAVARDRYFDLDAVRTPQSEPGRVFSAKEDHNPTHGEPLDRAFSQNPNGAPPLDHWWIDEDSFDQDAWLVPTQPFRGSHYATWPEKLCERPIKAMVPERVCTTCGEPARRLTQAVEGYADKLGESWADRSEGRDKADQRDRNNHSGQPKGDHITSAAYETVGWTDCGCEGGGARWRRGIVLDPFCGSGTTLAVAVGHGRDAIGIDIDERNADLACQRVGMFLTVEHLAGVGDAVLAGADGGHP